MPVHAQPTTRSRVNCWPVAIRQILRSFRQCVRAAMSLALESAAAEQRLAGAGVCPVCCRVTLGPALLSYADVAFLCFFFVFFLRKKPYMSANLANDSNTSRQIKETSRIVGYTARPTPGEAVPPWQATCTVHHDNLMGPPSRGGRIQSRMAPGMYHPCLSGRDTSKPRARRWPLTGGWLPREPTYAPILQPSSDATPCG